MFRKFFSLFTATLFLFFCGCTTSGDSPTPPPITSKDKPLWTYREGVQGFKTSSETITATDGFIYVGGQKGNQPEVWKLTPPPTGTTYPAVQAQPLSGGANGRLMSQVIAGNYIYYCGTSPFGAGFGFVYKIEKGTLATKDFVDFGSFSGEASSANDIVFKNDTLFVAGRVGRRDAVFFINATDFKKPMAKRYVASEPVMADANYQWVSIDFNGSGQLTLVGNETRFNAVRTYLRVLERNGQVYNEGHMPDEGQYRPIIYSHMVTGLWIYSVGKLDFSDGRYRAYSVRFGAASFSGGGSSLGGSLKSQLIYIDKSGWAIGTDEADSNNTDIIMSFIDGGSLDLVKIEMPGKQFGRGAAELGSSVVLCGNGVFPEDNKTLEQMFVMSFAAEPLKKLMKTAAVPDEDAGGFKITLPGHF